jgi:hypothetical protein
MVKMKLKPLDEAGFLPLLIMLVIIITVVVYLVYTRVLHAQGSI